MCGQRTTDCRVFSCQRVRWNRRRRSVCGSKLVKSSTHQPRPRRGGADTGGEYRDRTGDLLVANQALSQLSYRPSRPLTTAFPQRGPGHERPVSFTRTCQRTGPARVLSKLDRRARPTVEDARSIIEFADRRSPCGSRGAADSRKEVIQPQVLLQLPCYDFTPITDHTLGTSLPCGLAGLLLVQPAFVM